MIVLALASRATIAVLAAFVSFGALGAPELLVDADSKAPVADAWIVATRIECGGGMHCGAHCTEVRVAHADATGAYRFFPKAFSLNAYKDGYWTTYTPDHRVAVTRRRADARFDQFDPVAARLKHLSFTARDMSCFGGPPAQRANVLPVLREMFAEANRIAKLPEHRKIALEICQTMCELTVSPYGVALRPDDEKKQRDAYLRTVEPACVATAPPGANDDPEPFLRAVTRGDAPAVESAVKGGFDPNRLINDRDPAIVIASLAGNTDVIAALGRAGANMDALSASGQSALAQVVGPPERRWVGARRLEVIEALLQAGANPNRPDLYGYPPIIRAVEAGDVEVLLLLRRYKADIDARVSCQRADPNCTGKGNSVLHVVRGADMARTLLDQGADPNARATSGYTPLMHAYDPEVARIFLARGADPNLVDAGGWTALMYAVRSYERPPRDDRYRTIAEALVAAGARLDTTNQHGLDVFYYTRDEALWKRLRELAAASRR